jgi:hypothetical protein
LYTSKLVAGDVTGLAALVAVNATRGISNPVVADEMSNIADAAGAVPNELMPTFCDSAAWQIASDNIIRKETLLMVLSIITIDLVGFMAWSFNDTKNGLRRLPYVSRNMIWIRSGIRVNPSL